MDAIGTFLLLQNFALDHKEITGFSSFNLQVSSNTPIKSFSFTNSHTLFVIIYICGIAPTISLHQNSNVRLFSAEMSQNVELDSTMYGSTRITFYVACTTTTVSISGSAQVGIANPAITLIVLAI